MIISFTILVISCNSSNEKNQTSNSNNTTNGYDSAQGKSFVYTKYKLPLSVEVYKFLKTKNVQFNKQYLLGINSQDKYFTEEKRALALGTYSSDLVFATIFDQSQEAVEYFDVSIELAHKLDIEDGYSTNLLDKAYKNIENSDSLNYIAGEAYWKTCTNLEKNDRTNILPLIVMSSWLESMHTLSKASIGSSSETGLFIELDNQKENLVNLIAYFKDVISTQKKSELTEVLEKWANKLDQILAKYNEIKTTDKSNLGIEQFENVIFQIEDLRSQIIE